MSDKLASAFKVLFIEDDKDDYVLIRDLFSEEPLRNYKLDWVSAPGAFMADTACFDYDIYLLDYKLGETNGLEVMEWMVRKGCDAPIIFLTSHDEKEADHRAAQLGAADYILKNQVDATRLERSMRYAMEHKRTETIISRAKKQWEMTFDAIPDPIAVVDRNHRLVQVNRAMAERLGTTPQALIGAPCYTTVHNLDVPHPLCPHAQAMKDGQSHLNELYVENLGGYFIITASPYFDENSSLLGSIHVARDITNRKKAEDAVRKANEELEQRVAERTRELEQKTNDLLELNGALKFLLHQRDEDRKNHEQTVLTNIKSLIKPYLERLKKTRMREDQVEYINIIESHIDQIASPMARELSDKYLGLTPMELQVVMLIREGRSNKEIAEILNLSENTVKSHRYNLRNKLGIRGKRKNLKVSLDLSFQ